MTIVNDPTAGAVHLLTEWVQSHATSIPVLPALAARVISVASDPDASSLQLAHIIGKDQVLATRLLSLANSAYSAAVTDVTTIPEAVMRIGASGVRNLAVTVCFTSRMHERNVYGDLGPQLVDHGIGTAYLARLIADEAGEGAEEAFLAGLLHDIGKLVILKWHHEHQRRTHAPLEAEVLSDIVRRWHATVAGMAFRKWALPPEYDEPVMCHHDWTLARDQRAAAAVVYLANRLSHRYGFGCEAEEFDPASDPAAAELGIAPEWFDDLHAKAPGLFSVARSALAG